ncbi:MAG: hypothetical protein ACI8TX_002464 [Hyphomicrobiaceae bacterium]|jgi:hypothetical protein
MTFHRTRRRFSATCLAIASLFATPLAGSTVRAEMPATVQVEDGQLATVDGRFESLAETIAELCELAGVELRSYDATDRAVIGNAKDQPLARVLERLLSEENYLLGVRPRPRDTEATDIAWLRVTGSKGANAKTPWAGLNKTKAEDAASPPVPEELNSAAVMQAVAGELLADEARIGLFLATEPDAVATSLKQYPQAVAVLTNLGRRNLHPDVVEHIDAVIVVLQNNRPSAPQPSQP